MASSSCCAYVQDRPVSPCRALIETAKPSSLFAKLLSRNLKFALLGAHDGVANDHAYKLAIKHRWSGVALEPHPLHHESASAAYRASGLNVDVIQAAACVTDEMSLPLYHVDTSGLPFPWWVRQISSLDKQHVLDHNRLLDRAPKSCGNAGLPETCLRDKIKERLRVTEVPCVFTHKLARTYDPELLITDVEGLDDQTVASWLQIHSPKYILSETKNLSPPRVREFVRLLQTNGYCARDDGHDVYAIYI